MRIPKKISECQIFEPIWKKSATMGTFVNPRTGAQYQWPIFRVDSPPVNIVFPLTSQNEVIAIKKFQHGANSIILELPGGLSEKTEIAHDAAQRELLEETGYRAKTIAELGFRIYFEPSSLDFQFRPFIALDCEKVAEQKLDPNEDIEVALIGFPDWEKMIQAGQIFDAKSVVTTYLARAYLGVVS